MPNHRKRRKVECILCHRTFDSDYLTRHNRKYHADRLKKHQQHIPYKNAGAPANPFQVSNRHISIYIIYIFNINHLRYSKIEIYLV